MVRAYSRRTMDLLEIAISGAWHGEGFARTKRLPDLGKMLGRSKGQTVKVDNVLTMRETQKWREYFAQQAKR